jgi:hypothetical protein
MARSAQEAEIAHLRLPAIVMSSYPAADERVMRLEGLLEADGRLLTLVLKHILAHCASGYQVLGAPHHPCAIAQHNFWHIPVWRIVFTSVVWPI